MKNRSKKRNKSCSGAALDRPNPDKEHCTKVIKEIRERIDPWITKFDQWKEFQTEVRLNSISSMTPIAKSPESFVYGVPSNAQDPEITDGKIQQKTTQSSANIDEQLAHGQPKTAISDEDNRTQSS
ncbi:hypothetical protein F511_27637 [Dorcoceras hygrometricum]|uniref:Uncharacterized protein n=1 Tax=Dorcoceras hygrometricum TaxID=472368 RepID=A0A2Z7BI28_9LAMI|nr:hypothetical protein F511_27637 [Dorcoceras hygrometricum]